jgi:hypothetical protein
MDQKQPRLDFVGVRLAVYGQRNSSLHGVGRSLKLPGNDRKSKGKLLYLLEIAKDIERTMQFMVELMAAPATRSPATLCASS